MAVVVTLFCLYRVSVVVKISTRTSRLSRARHPVENTSLSSGDRRARFTSPEKPQGLRGIGGFQAMTLSMWMYVCFCSWRYSRPSICLVSVYLSLSLPLPLPLPHLPLSLFWPLSVSRSLTVSLSPPVRLASLQTFDWPFLVAGHTTPHVAVTRKRE